MQITNQKKMAAQILKCGVNRVWVDPRYVDQVSRAVQKSDVRELIEEGLITARPIQGHQPCSCSQTCRAARQRVVVVDTVHARVVLVHDCRRRIAGCEPSAVSVAHSRRCAKMAHLKQASIVTITERPRVAPIVPLPT